MKPRSKPPSKKPAGNSPANNALAPATSSTNSKPPDGVRGTPFIIKPQFPLPGPEIFPLNVAIDFPESGSVVLRNVK